MKLQEDPESLKEVFCLKVWLERIYYPQMRTRAVNSGDVIEMRSSMIVCDCSSAYIHMHRNFISA